MAAFERIPLLTVMWQRCLIVGKAPISNPRPTSTLIESLGERHMNTLVRMLIVLLVLLIVLPAVAQDATPEPSPDYLFEFPVPQPTAEQLEEALNCDLRVISQKRYPESIALADLPDEFLPETACDWAVLAATFSWRLSDSGGNTPEYPSEAIEAYQTAVTTNPVLALLVGLFDYSRIVPLVSPPTLGEIVAVTIHYDYGGMGNTTSWNVTITQANTQPVVRGSFEVFNSYFDESAPEPTPEVTRLDDTIDPELIQALAPALRDLLPIAETFSTTPCWDNYPDWTVTLTFDDDSELVLRTNNSNFFYVGGPWQVTIDEQSYVQMSFAFVQALLAMTDVLELPLGTTAAMGCGGADGWLPMAYPG
jgi:hypothetical protein